MLVFIKRLKSCVADEATVGLLVPDFEVESAAIEGMTITSVVSFSGVNVDLSLTLATGEDVSIAEDISENNDDVVPGILTVFSDDVDVAVEPELELVSSEGMTGRPDTVEEVLAVVENDDVEDADFISTLADDNVILKCIVRSVEELTESVDETLIGNNVVEESATVVVVAVTEVLKSVFDK